MQTGLATPASRDALLAGCVKALTQLQWGFDGHSSCLGELYCGLAQLFAADQPAEPSAGASDRYGFEAAALQSHFVPLLSADLAADGEKNTTGRPTKAAIVVRSSLVLRPQSSEDLLCFPLARLLSFALACVRSHTARRTRLRSC